MTTLEAALRYSEIGLSPIPVGKDKRPLIQWERYQKERATPQTISEWFDRWPDANVAVVTGSISGITVVDCDSAKGIETFESKLPQGFITPTQNTPRGGRHYICAYANGVRNNAKILPDVDTRGEGGYILIAPSSNGNGREYSFPPGFGIEDVPLAPVPEWFVSLCRDSRRQHEAQPTATEFFIEGRRDEDLFHVANSLVRGRCNQAMIPLILNTLAASCDPPFDPKDADTKIRSAIERANRRERNINSEVEEWILSATGSFFSSDIIKSLQLSTRDEQKNLSIILKRLIQKGVIRKWGDKNGHWQKVDDEVEIINWMTANEEEYVVEMPLGLDRLVKLYPGNIAILAGASNTGKTSFMLDLIRRNQLRHRVVYFNSEMGPQELKLRLSQFGDVCPLDMWRFTAIERSDKFADVIDPDALNIIDFMEVYDDFWKIGGWIRDIHSKLKKGVAFIAVQKKASSKRGGQQDYGRGGELTIEKPRLYLAMDRGVIRIVKAKIWRNPEENPNGMQRYFNLIHGWKFHPKTDWKNAEEERYGGFVHED